LITGVGELMDDAMQKAAQVALTNPTCRANGDVAFTPQAGKSYYLAVRIKAQACEGWIVELTTQRPVTRTVSGKGTKS
jgi:hypothetical protein